MRIKGSWFRNRVRSYPIANNVLEATLRMEPGLLPVALKLVHVPHRPKVMPIGLFAEVNGRFPRFQQHTFQKELNGESQTQGNRRDKCIRWIGVEPFCSATIGQRILAKVFVEIQLTA